jgi:hypothetical protein
MAGGNPIEINEYEFTAKPYSKWRRFVHDYWPYWQASRPRFLLTVKRLGAPSQQQMVTWFIKFPNSDYTYGQVSVPPLETGMKVNFQVGNDKFLGFTGDNLLVISSTGNLSTTVLTDYQTIYSFNVTPKVWIVLAIIAGFLAGIFTTLGQWLINIFN